MRPFKTGGSILRYWHRNFFRAQFAYDPDGSTLSQKFWFLKVRLGRFDQLYRHTPATVFRSVHVIVNVAGHCLDIIPEKVIGARKDAVIDFDPSLHLELFNQTVYMALRHDIVAVALQDQARSRAGGQKGKVVKVGGRSHRNKALDFRAPH